MKIVIAQILVCLVLLGCSHSTTTSACDVKLAMYSSDELMRSVNHMAGGTDRTNKLTSDMFTLKIRERIMRPFFYIQDEFPRQRLEEDAQTYLRVLDSLGVELPLLVSDRASPEARAALSDVELVIFVRFLKITLMNIGAEL